MKTTVCILILLLGYSLFAQPDQEHELVLELKQGKIKGSYDSGIHIFKGIPFAQPPIGELRWKAPQDPLAWEGIKELTSFGPRAMQRPFFDDMNFRSDGMSEDCLYLNVWTPAQKGDEKLAVLVYFYGGGLLTGDGSEYRYDGESMARKGIISITVNYRLNVFGFLSHPELSEETAYGGSGNYGFMDQWKALEWIHENIELFGGDPAKITIAGESAGSVSVCAQMASPLSKDLLAGAIGSSGSIMGTLGAVELEKGEKVGMQFQEKIGVASLSDLRALSAEDILAATTQFSPLAFAPTIDGYFFPKAVNEIFKAGEQAQIPLFLGWNSQEGYYPSVFQGKEVNVKNYKAALEKMFPGKGEEAYLAYFANNEEDLKQVASDLAGDNFTGFSTWKWGEMHAKSGKPVFQYFYKHPRPALDENSPKGAVHSAEIEYAMGNLPTNKVYAWTDDDYQVSSIFQNYYFNFVSFGDPNGLGLPIWPAKNKGDTPYVLQIDAKTKVEQE
ncbi:MAG: carboxylesterase family protein, partial [Bacteroidota bacterium]